MADKTKSSFVIDMGDFPPEVQFVVVPEIPERCNNSVLCWNMPTQFWISSFAEIIKQRGTPLSWHCDEHPNLKGEELNWKELTCDEFMVAYTLYE